MSHAENRAHPPGEVHPLLNDPFRRQTSTDDPHKVRLKQNGPFEQPTRHRQPSQWRLAGSTHIVFVQSQMMRGQHPDPQPGAQRGVQEVAEDGLIL